MPISLAQYLEEAPERDQAAIGLELCEDCGVPLQETIAGYRPTGEQHAKHAVGEPVGAHGAKCSDCYFDRLGTLAEEYPIGRPTAVRRRLV